MSNYKEVLEDIQNLIKMRDVLNPMQYEFPETGEQHEFSRRIKLLNEKIAGEILLRMESISNDD